ncbi:MAG: transposase [candidate division Zixibacteria bacterium]|nr:transposase [candidate division Zixibacteria bacterium]
MKTLRRYDLQHSYFFLTVVTYRREKLLLRSTSLFFDCWTKAKPVALVVLPDHFHVIVRSRDVAISNIMHDFKIRYSKRFRDLYRDGRVWQNRFWDHVIRDQRDMNKHVDYIHYNPVRHGIVDDPFDYEHSSLQRWFEEGYYPRNWGVQKEISFTGDFGE